MRKFFVTGGAGFIGSAFVRLLLEEIPSCQVINFDALTYAGNLDNLKEIGEGRRVRFKRHGAGRRVPGADEESGGGGGAVEIACVLCERVQKHECACRVAGDFGRHRIIPRQIGAIISGHAAFGLLDAGVQKPRSGA